MIKTKIMKKNLIKMKIGSILRVVNQGSTFFTGFPILLQTISTSWIDYIRFAIEFQIIHQVDCKTW